VHHELSLAGQFHRVKGTPPFFLYGIRKSRPTDRLLSPSPPSVRAGQRLPAPREHDTVKIVDRRPSTSTLPLQHVPFLLGMRCPPFQSKRACQGRALTPVVPRVTSNAARHLVPQKPFARAAGEVAILFPRGTSLLRPRYYPLIIFPVGHLERDTGLSASSCRVSWGSFPLVAFSLV